MVSVVMRVDRCPVVSLDLVAYFARYPATEVSVNSLVKLTGRMSSWGPRRWASPADCGDAAGCGRWWTLRPVPCDPEPGPYRDRQHPMDDAVEARDQRVHRHLR